VVQRGHTSDLGFGVATLLEYVTEFMTLLPGDVLLTGTPEGVGPLAAGDVVEIEVDGIGVLRNPVIGP
jgi:2-keto-4-pentenoate hydratase/2-oxohepta-3-ene-1,7-dioic acid hydratase in catechol pathway